MRMKKFLTFLLTLAMVVSLLPASAFAANNTATTMRLAKTQGTVAVTNTTGKKVTQTSNMKLYNGYKIKTGAKSYAWISLDDTKAAKVDANSVVSVQKSGQKLTLYLSSGNIFFNVKEKLSGGESFHIKTSTMTTGIRGTSGCVRVISPRVTEIHLLTGQIEVYTENPELNISKTAVLTAGQKATSLIAEDAMAATGKQAEIIIEQLTHREVCGNCATEIAADPQLVERIKEEAPHLLPEKIADEAADRLKADEQAAAEKQAAIDQAAAKQELPEDVDPYFEKEETGGGGGSSSGGGGGGTAPGDPEEPEDPEDPALPEEVPDVIQVRTWAELIDAVGVFNNNAKNITIEVVGEITQNAETTIFVDDNGNTLTIDLTTAGITMESTIVNDGNLVITNTAGYITTEAQVVVQNNGTFTLDDGTLETLDATTGRAVENKGTFIMDGGAIKGSAANGMQSFYGVVNSGIFTMNGGSIHTVSVAVLNGNNNGAGTLRIYDGAELQGNVRNQKGTAELNGGVFTAGVTNDDVMTIAGGDFSKADGTVVANSSTGVLTMTGGTVTADAAAEVAVDNTGTVTTPVDASVRAVTQANVWTGTMPTGYAVSNAAENGYFYLTTAAEVPEVTGEWARFTAQIDEFNAGSVNRTITLNGELNPTAEELEEYALHTIANNNATLTIDLNGYDIILPLTLKNEGGLVVTGGGNISGTAVSTMIQNNGGTLELADVELTLTANQTGIANAAGVVNMTDGLIQLNGQNSYGILSELGTVNMTGGQIVLAAADNYGIYGVNAAVTLAGGTVYENDGLTANSNYAVHTDGGMLELVSGSITAHNGYAVGVSDVADLSLTGATVLAKNADNLLVAANSSETGFTFSTYDATYFVLENEVAYDGINTWEEFMAALNEFNNGDTAQTILLTGNIYGDAGGTALTVDNLNDTGLIIDLDTYTLALPTTLTVTGSSLTIAGTSGGDVEGTLTTSADWDGSTYLIDNNATVTVNGGAIVVPASVTGVNNSGAFNLSANASIYADGGVGVENAGGGNAMINGSVVATNTGVGLENSGGSMEIGTNAMIAVDSGSVGIEGSGTVNLNGGVIYVAGNDGMNWSTGVYAGGTVTLNGTTIEVTDNAIGIEGGGGGVIMESGAIDVIDGTGVSMGHGIFDMNGGTITVDSGTGVVAAGPLEIGLNGGTITADTADATAVLVTNPEQTVVTVADGMIVKATVQANVYSGTLPDGYVVSDAADGEGYYALIYDDGINTWAELMAAIDDFNSSSAAGEITLTDSIYPDSDEVSDVAQLPIYNQNGAALTLNLGLHTLALPATLQVASPLVITAESGGDVEGTITAGTEFDASGSVYLISNESDLELASGTIIVYTGRIGVYNEGTFEMSDGYIMADGGTGIENANDATISGGRIQVMESGIGVMNANMVTTMKGGIIDVQSGTGVNAFTPFLMEGGQIVASGGTGLSVAGAATLTKGEITADYDAVAVANNGTVSMGEDMTVRATVADNVMTLTGTATLPDGYVVSTATDGEGYYHLTPSTATVPMNVSDWGEFVAAVAAFNSGSAAETITLMEDIDPTAEQVLAVEQTYGVTLPAIGNGNSSDLTINLGGHILGLPTTLATASSSGLVIDGTGTITTGQEWDGSDYIINNYTDLTLRGGTIAVPMEADGINNTGTFNMEGGLMEIDYSVGINNSNAVNLNGGYITMIKNDAYNGVPVPNGGDFSAYKSVYDSGATLTMGANGTDGTLIIVEEGINYMESDDLYLMHMAIDNSSGCEVTIESGEMTIASGDGIVNDGELTLNGGEFVVNGGRGIYNYGTFAMNDGMIEVYIGEGMTIDGTSTTLAGGSITITADATEASTGVQALSDITFSGTTIEAYAGTAVKAVSDTTGKSMALHAGSITAEDGAVAIETNFTTVTYNETAMTVRATASENVYAVAAGGSMIEGYEPADGGDGYYYLTPVAGSNILEVDTVDEIVDAFDTVNSRTNTYIIRMTGDITMEITTDGEGNDVVPMPLDVYDTTTTTLDLNGNTLSLFDPLTNYGTLAITDSSAGRGGVITGTTDNLIDNMGDLTWDYGNMIVSTANGTGVTAGGTTKIGNGSLNSDTVISLTGSGATAIHVAGGATATLDGVQIDTNANADQIGVWVDSTEKLIVDRATIYVAAGNTGIENDGTTILNGADMRARNGNTGTLVKNINTLVLNDGTLWTDTGAAISMTAGTFTMTGGDITTTSYYYGALRMLGGTANLNGGNIKVNNNGGGEIGVSMNNSTLNLDGTVITVNGFDATGIRGSGTMNLESGTVTAENAGAVAIELVSGGSGTSITLGDAVKIRAMTEANVLTPDDTDLGFVTEDRGDGYFYLAAAAGTPVIEVADEADFAAAVAGLTDGDVQIILMGDVTLSTGYEFGDGEANVGALDINLNGNDLILTQTLYNNTGLYIYGGGSISSVDDTAYELIINNGTLVWEDTEMIVKAGQAGIYTGGELTMNSGAITGPDLEGAEEYTDGVLYQSSAEDRTTVSDAVTVTGNITKLKVAEV